MCKSNTAIAFVVIVLSGCASGPPGKSAPDYPRERAEIQQRLEEIFDAAEKKDFGRLEGYHRYGPKFTKFSTESPGRQNADVARKGERDGLGAVNGLEMRADDLKIDVFGKVGIATFVLRYTFKAGEQMMEREARTTMVFAKDGKEWRIAHEHLSAIQSRP